MTSTDDSVLADLAAEQALAALRWTWGEFYLIGYDDEHGWWAARRDRIGALLTEEGPGELRTAMAEEYGVKPVKPERPGNPRGLEAQPDEHAERVRAPRSGEARTRSG